LTSEEDEFGDRLKDNTGEGKLPNAFEVPTD